MAQINVRIDDDLKKESIRILDSLGLDLTSAVKMFLKQVVLQEGRIAQFDDVQSLKKDLTNED